MIIEVPWDQTNVQHTFVLDLIDADGQPFTIPTEDGPAPFELPIFVAGGAAGKMKGGRHLAYADKPSMANLLVTLMDKLDVPVEKIGVTPLLSRTVIDGKRRASWNERPRPASAR